MPEFCIRYFKKQFGLFVPDTLYKTSAIADMAAQCGTSGIVACNCGSL